MMKRSEKMMLIVLLIVLISPFVIKRLGWLDQYVGTDDQARTMVGQIRPEYRPWFRSVFKPGDMEEWLFAMHVAIGAGIFSYCLIKLHARRRDPRSRSEDAGQ